MPEGQVNPNEDDYREDEECTEDECEVTTDGGNEEDEGDDDDGIEVIVDVDDDDKQPTGFKIVDGGGCPPIYA